MEPEAPGPIETHIYRAVKVFKGRAQDHIRPWMAAVGWENLVSGGRRG